MSIPRWSVGASGLRGGATQGAGGHTLDAIVRVFLGLLIGFRVGTWIVAWTGLEYSIQFGKTPSAYLFSVLVLPPVLLILGLLLKRRWLLLQSHLFLKGIGVGSLHAVLLVVA